jgi:hypothetical protein
MGEPPVGAVHITVADCSGLVLIIVLVLWLTGTMGPGMLR